MYTAHEADSNLSNQLFSKIHREIRPATLVRQTLPMAQRKVSSCSVISQGFVIQVADNIRIAEQLLMGRKIRIAECPKFQTTGPKGKAQ